MQSLEEDSKRSEYTLHYSLKTNKLELLFQGAKEFMDKHFSAEGFNFTIDEVTPTNLSTMHNAD
ncbi:MAG: hypothetical protein MRQ13_05250 [Candidatus Midichloria sp.]|nr:hypothetical protein [Candidatus Midichloria sp.]